MVHLHGPWGAGKSSLVRFLADALNRESPHWLVVDFNAWRNARVKPPWWHMLTEWKRLLSRRMLADVTLLRWAWVSPSVNNIALARPAGREERAIPTAPAVRLAKARMTG